MPASQSIIVPFFFLVTGIILVLVSLLVWFILFYQRRQHDNAASMESLKLAHEHTLLQVKVEVKEMTMQHISREIHDDITSTLGIAMMQLNTIALPAGEDNKKLKGSIALMAKSIEELRDLSRSLSRDILENQGLVKALEEEINRVRSAVLFTLDMEITGEPPVMDPSKELVIFRVIQEALANIRRHAAPNYARLLLQYTADEINVFVSDDGRGFNMDENTQKKGKGAGLKNMASRIAGIDGTMVVESKPGQGTTIHLGIPIKITGERKIMIR